MKKRTTIAVLLIFLASLALTPGAVLGQGFGLTWESGITVANQTNTPANIVITFYPQTGTPIPYTPTTAVPGGGSLKFFPLTMLADGFNGSAVVSSDQPVAAIVNQLTTVGGASGPGGSYEGLAEGALEVTLPIAMRNNGGYSSTFNVQNAGSGNATINIEFTPGVAGSADTDGPFTIEPGRAMTFNQADDTELGTRFVGSAKVTSNEPIVIALNQVNPLAKVILSYRGFTQGSTSVALPTIQNDNGNYDTGLAVKNVGTACTNVTVTYGANTVGSFNPAAETQNNVCAGQSVNFNQWGGQWDGTGKRYVGSATVTNSAGQPLVVNVNQLKQVAPAQGSAYSGFDPDAATTKIVIPTLMAFNGGFSTGFLVQNVGTGPANFTVTFATSAGSYTADVETVTNIAVGAGFNFRQYAGQWTDPAKNNSQRWVGSAVVQCTQKCVAVVNQVVLSGSTADTLLTYTGINVTP